MINVRNVTKTFGNFKALDNASLHVNKGSVYGLIGPNGAGKTTIIKQLVGIYTADKGTIEIDGQGVFENPKLKDEIFYIGDELYYFPAYSVKDMAKFYAKVYGKWSWDRYEALKAVFKIDEKRKVKRLSKGVQKQVAFWFGVCACPKVMILDEPVDGLDPVMRKNVWKIVLQDVAENGTTVLISSHNLRELEDVCDSVGIMFKGKVVLEKDLDQIKGNIHKVQLVFEDELPNGIIEKLNVLSKEQLGRVHTLIIKGEGEAVLKEINMYNPIICDMIPLTLEEVFIYELGGMGYEFENVII